MRAVLGLALLAGLALVTWCVGSSGRKSLDSRSASAVDPVEVPNRVEPPPTLAAHPTAQSSMDLATAPASPRALLVVDAVEGDREVPISGVETWIQDDAESVAVSGPDGKASIAAATQAGLLVGHAPDGRWATVAVEASTSSARLVFASDVRLAGIVTHADGSPAAGLRLRVLGMGADDPTRTAADMRDYFRRAERMEVVCDEAGRFAIRGWNSSHAILSSADSGTILLVPDGHANVEVPATYVRIRAARAEFVRVRFRDADGLFPVIASVVRLENSIVGHDIENAPTLASLGGTQVFTFAWPVGASAGGEPVIQVKARGYVSRSATIDRDVARRDGAFVVSLARDPASPPTGAIRVVGPKLDDMSRLMSFVDLIPRGRERELMTAGIVTVGSERWIVGIAVGEYGARFMDRNLDADISVRAGTIAELRLDFAETRLVRLRPLLRGQRIGGPALLLLQEKEKEPSRTSSARIAIDATGVVWLGLLGPGTYVVHVTRETDHGKASFTIKFEDVRDGAATSDLVVDVPLENHVIEIHATDAQRPAPRK